MARDWSRDHALWLACGIVDARPWLWLVWLAACAPAAAPPPHLTKTDPPQADALQAEPGGRARLVEAPQAQPVAPSAPVAEAASSELVELELQGREPLVVSLPADAGSPQPVAVVAHGAGGLATTHCRIWRRLMGRRGFIVCPRGRPMYPYAPGKGHGYYFGGHPELGEEIGEALERVRAEYGDRVDLQRPLFVGYSQGASMGSMILPSHPAKFARAVLMEGGFGQHQEWNVAASRRFHALGAERVLLACGRISCLELARTTASYMRRGGLEAKVVYAEGAGHTYGEPMQHTVQAALAWLIRGDSRW